MDYQLKISTHMDLDCIEDDKERADLQCDYLMDIADVYYTLVQFESSYPHLISFDRYSSDLFSITVSDDDINLITDIEDKIQDILLKNDVSFATIEEFEEC